MAPLVFKTSLKNFLFGFAYVVFSSALVGVQAEPVTLIAPVNRTVGVGPYSLVNGDFNGDGKLDTAAANFVGNNVSVVFGDGTGNFSAPTYYTAGDGPRFLVAADMNNDTKLDLVVVSSNSNDFTVLTNNGTGVFTAASYPSGFGPGIATVADLNGDGRLDVVTSNDLANTLNVSLATAGGGFVAPVLISMPNFGLKCVVARDVNGDSKPDLITANSSKDTISVLLGDGMGNFGAPSNFSIGPANSAPYFIALGDFNGDSKVDALVPLYVTGKVAFMAGSGTGTFTLTSSFALNASSIGDGPVFTALRDVNGDGKLDILTACYKSDTIYIQFGNGSGGVASTTYVLVGEQPHAVDTGDFNGDGLVDLDSVSDIDTYISIMLNRGSGVFPTSNFVDSQIGKIQSADLNGDGKADIVINGFRVLLGNGDGTFGAATNYGSGVPTDFILADVNNDGKPDIVASGSAVNGVRIRLNNGSGSFTNTFTVGTDDGQVGVGDFNLDGKVDLVIALAADTAQNVRFYQGDGLGNFALASGLTLAGGTQSLLVTDLNNDGHPDLAEINANHTAIKVEFMTGAYTFSAATTVVSVPEGIGCGNATLAVGDVTGDGKLDLVAAAPCYVPGPNVWVGDGAGGFPSNLTVPLPQQQAAVAVADFNRDGKLDFASMGPSQLNIAYSQGNGQFSITKYAAGRASRYMITGDFNNDSVPDLMFAQEIPFSGIGLPGETGARIMLSRSLGRGRTSADFDGDGKTDLSVFRPSTGTWYILRSSDNSFYGVQFGQNGDRPVPGDYDGDGKTDIAVFRPTTGYWYYLRSLDGSLVVIQHGTAGDVPVPADYDGDGKTNIAVFRPSNSTWYTSTNPAINYGAFQWGFSSDIPTPADYDGDGKADIAVFRASIGTWYLMQSSAGYLSQQQGVNGDRPVPFDFDGDRKANIAVFRPSNGTWYRSTNAGANYNAIQWGQIGDWLTPGYYDDDNQADVAIFRNGTWYIFYSSTNTYAFFNFGTTGDIPIPSMYVPQ